MILMNSRELKTYANGLKSSFALKNVLVATLCMVFVAAAALESAAQQYVVRITPSVSLQQAMTDAGVPVSAAHLTVEGGPLKTTDFEYVRTRMAGTLQTLDMSAATAANNAIPSLALENCTALSSVKIPNTVTSVQFGAFLHCTALVSAEIPADVTSIGGGAFRDCGVSSITCYAPVPPVLFDELFDNPYGITLSVPYGTKALYESAYLWKECGTITELPASTDASLKRIDVSAGTLSPPFNPSTTNYTLSVPNSVTGISVAGTSNHYRATVVGNVTDKPLAPGNNEIAITVTAEDGTTKRTYRITAVRAHSTDATLKSIALSVNGVSLVPVFDPGTTDYAVEVENEITGVSVTATANHPGASVNGGGNSTSVNKSLATGPNTVDITVTAEDGTTQKTYRIVFNRLLSADASLKDLTTDRGATDPSFHAATKDYTVKVAYAVMDITIVAQANNPVAGVGGDGYKTLNPGANVFPVVVTAENGTQTTYTLTVVRQSDDAELANLTVGAGTLTPAFIPSTTDYAVNVGSETTDLAAVGTPRHPGASVVVTGGSSLVTGTNTVDITVTSEDATVTKLYRITAVRAPSSNTRLANILVSTGTIAFDPAATSFTVHAGTATRIDVRGIASHPNAMVLGNVVGKSLSRGDNFVTITVVAEDGTTADYPVRIVRAPSSDASLSDIVLSYGSLTPLFTPRRYDYTVNVPNGVTRISVAGIRNHDSATITGNLTDKEIWVKGTNVARITVTAEDGAVTTVYTVRIVRAPSSDARLKDITVDAGALSPAFDVTVPDYTVNVGNGTTSIAVVGTPEHDSATVAAAGGSSLAVGDNPVTVTVTAEDGHTTQSYTVTVVRAKSSDASLQNIRAEAPVAGVLAVYPPFDPDVTDYTVAVANAVMSITVTGEKRHYASTVTGDVADKALVVGNNLVSLTVTAEDGTVKVYSLTVVRMSDDADLNALTVNSGTLSPAFVPGTVDYTVDVPNDTAEITVWGTANHAKATVAGNGRHALAVGANPIDVTVTAEDPSATKVYTVTVVRAPASDAVLQDIQVSAGSLSFIDGVTDYAVVVANSVDAVTLTGVKRHPEASVSGDGVVALNVGDNVVNITVTAEDRTTIRTYRVTVHRLSNDASLSALAVSEGALTPAFDAAVTDYAVTVGNAVTSINIAGIARHPSASVAGNVANKTLPVGATVVNVTVTAEDETVRTYKVTVRRLSNDATLSSLTVSTGSISPTFNPVTKDYAVTVANSVTSIGVTGIANHPGAGVAGNVANKSLTAGVNVVSIVVTAEDGTSLTYKVTVHRL
jgi:tRNA threonylcarbamoyladenosine modification (KEOPS) complex  Pcc1 subunit